jgi:Tol biopolymer transport system component
VPAAEHPSACFERIVTLLADDAMEGRGIGTDGLEKAALYLEDEFDRLGLADGGVNRGQRFEAEIGVKLGPENELAWSLLNEEPTSGRISQDFTPLGFSSSREFAGPVVFVGYGIRAEPLGYDDYEGVDVRGKVALAMRYEPGERDENSPFDGVRPTRWSELRYKALAAREAGAVALIFVSPPAEGDEEPERLPLLRNEVLLSRAGLPVLQITRNTADAWLASAGHDLAGLRADIDGDFQPRSLPLPALEVRGRSDVATTDAPVRNVAGVLPGRGALADEAVVVGAHYDHLGLGGARSLEPDTVSVHNGADDNASGVAAMLCAVPELRRRFASEPGDRRTLVVLAFAAEEIGLGGSGHYVKEPVFPLDRTVAMVNLDMVGRLREGRLSTMGSESAGEWEALLQRNAEDALLSLVTGGDGYGPSDQMSFYQNDIPVVHLFTGAHSEYHTPADDVATLNMEGGGRVADFLAAVLGDLLANSERLTFAATGSAPSMGGDSRSYGAYLGSIPDYTTMASREGGVLLSGVRTDGPADRGGVRQGDTIVEMAGVEILNLYDMTFVLREHRPGETVPLSVLRDGERVQLQVTLGRRGEQPSGGAHEPAPEKAAWAPKAGRDAAHLRDEREQHLADLRQLTFDGENAEAYFSPDGRSLVFQRTPPEGGCDQQYLLDLDSGEVTLLSSGSGRTTCGYYAYPEGERLIYATTERADPACPAPPDRSKGYVWGLYDFDLVWQAGPGARAEPFASQDGSYDAEATVCMQDGRVVFTSDRDGDLELYVVNADGSGLSRLTHTPGYDGGAFFTADCSGIVFRASRPSGPALAEYRALLAEGLVRPSALEIFWMDADGSNEQQLTDNGAANFAPYPAPDGRSVLFASNMGGSAREFDLYRVGRDGGEPERISFSEGFDGFPMFSPDGRWLVFASNRAGGHQTNLYIARWVP